MTKTMNKIRISIQECIEVEAESEELTFDELKHQVIELLDIAKKSVLRSEPNHHEVT